MQAEDVKPVEQLLNLTEIKFTGSTFETMSFNCHAF